MSVVSKSVVRGLEDGLGIWADRLSLKPRGPGGDTSKGTEKRGPLKCGENQKRGSRSQEEKVFPRGSSRIAAILLCNCWKCSFCKDLRLKATLFSNGIFFL